MENPLDTKTTHPRLTHHGVNVWVEQTWINYMRTSCELLRLASEVASQKKHLCPQRLIPRKVLQLMATRNTSASLNLHLQSTYNSGWRTWRVDTSPLMRIAAAHRSSASSRSSLSRAAALVAAVWRAWAMWGLLSLGATDSELKSPS